MKRFISCVMCISVIFLSLYSQEESDSVKHAELKLLHLFNQLYSTDNETVQNEINDSVIDIFSRILNSGETFTYPFDTLQRIGKIISKDERVRVFTWNTPKAFGRSNYYGLIAHYNKQTDTFSFYPLKNTEDLIENEEFRILDLSQWPGALYYEIIDFKQEGKVHYILLGLNLMDVLTNRKYIDILSFDENGIPKLGEKIFKTKTKLQSRVFFDYAERASMSIKYNPKLKMIVFDHLSPDRPSLEGQYQFYGPDLSFDGFKLNDGFWEYHEDINITN